MLLMYGLIPQTYSQCLIAAQASPLSSCVETAPDGPFTVKLYIHTIRHTDGSGGISPATISVILKTLESDFKSHNIYFSLACINDIHDSFYMLPVNFQALFTSSYAEPDGINLFVFELPGSSGGGGLAAGVPAISAYVTVSNFEPNYKVVSHEIGHCLGLTHTFQGSPHSSEAGISPAEHADGGNCCTAGDFVCDTPADPGPGLNGEQPDCSWLPPAGILDPENQLYTTTDTKNIMSYFSDCRLYFTPKQGVRMRYFLSADAVLQPVRKDNASIWSDETWTTNRHFDSDLRVLSDQELKIVGATLYMAPNTKIIVEKGAVLNLKSGAKITVDPGMGCTPNVPFWKGIELRGGANNTEEPAYVLVSSAIIEFAQDALYYPQQGTSSSYGRIHATQATFRNNQSALTLLSSFPQFSIYNTIPSNFYRTQFIVDQDYPDGAIFKGFASLAYVKNIRFMGCTFDNQLYEDYKFDDRNYAIWSLESIFTLKSRCSSGYLESQCPPEQYTPSILRGFKTSVYASSSHGSTILDNRFSRFLNKAVDITSSQSIVAQKNDIEFNSEPEAGAIPRIGLQFDKCTGFAISDNAISADYTDAPTETGILIKDAGSEYNEAVRNELTGLRVGMAATGINHNTAFPFNGLQFLCNDMQNGLSTSSTGPFDILINGRIATSQGSQSIPAGNTFSHNTAPAGSDIRNNFSFLSPVTYHYWANSTEQEPLNILGITKVASNFTPSCSPTPNVPDLEEIAALYLISKNRYDSLSGIYNSLVDGGQTVYRLEELLNATTAGAVSTLNQLWALSPYLSAQVLMAFYDRSDLYSDTQRYDLIAANPDALKYSDLREWISNSPEALPASLQTQLLELPLTATPRTALEAEMSFNYGQAGKAANNALYLLYAQDSVDNLSHIREWAQKKQSLYATIEQIDQYFAQSPLSSLSEYANSLTWLQAANEEEAAQFAQYMDYVQTLHNALIDGRNFFELDSSEINQLIAIASSDSYAATTVRDFLHIYYSIEVNLPEALKSDFGRRTAYTQPTGKVQDTAPAFEIYPNPSNGEWYIGFTANNEDKIANLQLFNSTGQCVDKSQLRLSSSTAKYTTHNLPPGWYWLTIWIDGRLLGARKVLVSR
ncbi:MAG: zinc-dependent metalloprotease [Saprospiraceae bacterium]|nr:zinc-dependent metalloprotease [Saprospiraceae bacterium]